MPRKSDRGAVGRPPRKTATSSLSPYPPAVAPTVHPKNTRAPRKAPTTPSAERVGPIHFTVEGRPVSVNRCYHRARNGRMFMSPEGREYKERVAAAARIAMGDREPMARPLVLSIAWYFDRAIAGTSIAFPDDDGPLKPTRDAMEASQKEDLKDALVSGGIYENDRWIVQTIVSKHLDRERPRAEIWVWPAEARKGEA